MPELPEVENVRQGLLSAVVGQTVSRVSLRRPDVVRGKKRPADLLKGQMITRVDRKGKQLALVTEMSGAGGGVCLCVHLGMTGSLRCHDPRKPFVPDGHTHVVWHMANGSRLAFRDPRRFGGIWTFASTDDLIEQRWSRLGPDALMIKPTQLHSGFRKTRRVLKAVLLDQSIVAGLGNIYVDELLFNCRVSPVRPACELDHKQVQQLVTRMRRLLDRAIRSGGSTLRDYTNAQGQPGGYQFSHKVYGRSGQACAQCGGLLSNATIAGRTTVYCEQCQE